MEMNIRVPFYIIYVIFILFKKKNFLLIGFANCVQYFLFNQNKIFILKFNSNCNI